jgi:hypothetical protein
MQRHIIYRISLISIFVLALSLPSNVLNSEGIPQQISYQGKLTEDGIPVHNAFRKITFSIAYDSKEWKETHEQVKIMNGLYSVILGSINKIPLNLFNNQERKLKIAVNDTLLEPDIVILSVGYAFRSANSDNANLLNGKNPAYYLNLDTINQIQGDANRNIDLVAGKGIAITKDQTKHSVYIASTVKESTSVLDSPDGNKKNVVHVTNSGNVGVGTQAPSEKMHVNGNLKINGNLINKNGQIFLPYFFLDGERQDEASPRVLSWPSMIQSGKYNVYRNDKLIKSLNANTITWTDSELKLTGTLKYRVTAKMSKTKNIATTINTNVLEFLNTRHPNFGDGSDGSFHGGNIDRSRNYFFSKIHLYSGSVMSFTGEGNGIIRVLEDMIVEKGATINLRVGGNLNAGNFTFNGVTKKISADGLVFGKGEKVDHCGNTGKLIGEGGEGGTFGDGKPAINSICGGNGGGAGGIFPGGNGSDGQSSTHCGFGGGGGAAGAKGKSVEKIVFVVKGNAFIDGTINGQGIDGGDGGKGGKGTITAYVNEGRIGCSGGHGAGGPGGHGGHLYIFVKGTYDKSKATLNLNGGKAGIGGNPPSGDGKDGDVEFISVSDVN